MESAAGVPARLLTPMGGQANRYKAKPGILTLNVRNIGGKTEFETGTSIVMDVTDRALPIAVSHECTESSFSFQVEVGKTYYIALAFVQKTNPYESVAKLDEGGQEIDIISMANLFPNFFVCA